MASSQGRAVVPGRQAASSRLRGVMGLLALLGTACEQPEPLALEHEVYEVDGESETLVDASCDELPENEGSFGFGFGTAPGARPVAYSFNYAFETERVLFSAGPADGPPLTQREYDEAFLRSDGVDDFLVELGENFALHVINRAAPGCSGPGKLP